MPPLQPPAAVLLALANSPAPAADAEPDGGGSHAMASPAEELPWGERPVVAVGRVPARDQDELRGFVKKVLAHERDGAAGPASRRLVVTTGPARFGAMVDTVLERTALRLLDSEVPYDYDLSFTFAKPGSPYAYRFDRLADKLVEDANAGALLLAYVGHSSYWTFDWVDYRGHTYPIGSRSDFARMEIRGSRPLFLSLSCEAGAYDLPGGQRSMAEEAAMNPTGPVASFASSRASHPYPNLLYGEAFVARFLKERPKTIGEGLLAVKLDVETRSSLLGELFAGVDTDELRLEHLGLYNLLGDPATHLFYPALATLEVEPKSADDSYAPAMPLAVVVRSELDHGSAEVTVERRRKDSATTGLAPAQLDELALEDAFTRMAADYGETTNKVITRTQTEIHQGHGRAEITTPPEPGSYVLRVLVTSPVQDTKLHSSVASGFSLLLVGLAPGP